MAGAEVRDTTAGEPAGVAPQDEHGVDEADVVEGGPACVQVVRPGQDDGLVAPDAVADETGQGEGLGDDAEDEA